MKKQLLATVLALLLLAAATACSKSESDSAAPPPPATSTSSSPAMDKGVPVELTPEQRETELYGLLWAYVHNGSLTTSWEGSLPLPPTDTVFPQNFVVRSAAQNTDGSYTITVELLSMVYLYPETMTESILDRIYDGQHPPIGIMTEGLDCSPQLPVGSAQVRVTALTHDATVLACSYTAHENPGISYLKAQTEVLRPQLENSKKLDVAQYDSALVQYIWRLLAAQRYIEKPEDITLYDLESYHGALELNYSTVARASYDDQAMLPVDAGLLRLLPNVETVDVNIPLQDYSVFEKMNKLEALTLYALSDDQLATLRVGNTAMLVLQKFGFSVLDLSEVNTQSLSLTSWSEGISGFRGCEKIRSLYINSTRTDMRLINAETFPNASYLNLQFYSDTARVRDFSQLATFENATIDLMLSYQACNSRTVESLAGVPVRLLVLNPKNGSYPLDEPDPALVEAIPAKTVIWGEYMYFEERNLQSVD